MIETLELDSNSCLVKTVTFVKNNKLICYDFCTLKRNLTCLLNVNICLQLAGMKRPSPEPADNSLAKIQKKPKAQKKKKKRDPNEPQK